MCVCECVFIWRLGGGVGGVGSGKRGGCSGGRWLVDTDTQNITQHYHACIIITYIMHVYILHS